ncbi:MAG: RNA polymerase sigma factor [Kiritimatiellae bacterium]|nr:RNA polymerase sigma factor [Kiritimatiellia bacterium]
MTDEHPVPPPPSDGTEAELPADGAPPDLDLMDRTGRDDTEAFRLLVERHQQPLLNFFTRLGASTLCEDLAQETFVRLWKYRKKYRPSAKFTTFLYTLARHAWQDACRRQARFASFQERYARETASITDGGLPALRKDMDVQAALDALSPKHREVLVLAVYQGLRYEEIAQVLSIPVGTVKSRVFNALSTLQRMFQDEDYSR